MRITFEKVELIGRKAGKCKCGKRRSRTKVFMQTINPFNKTPTGTVKDREQIRRELRDERDLWQFAPITCDGCEAVGQV